MEKVDFKLNFNKEFWSYRAVVVERSRASISWYSSHLKVEGSNPGIAVLFWAVMFAQEFRELIRESRLSAMTSCARNMTSSKEVDWSQT